MFKISICILICIYMMMNLNRHERPCSTCMMNRRRQMRGVLKIYDEKPPNEGAC